VADVASPTRVGLSGAVTRDPGRGGRTTRDAGSRQRGGGDPDPDAVDPAVAEAVDRAAAELYDAPPGDFVGLRTRLAREAKTSGLAEAVTRITALRKPSLAAWAINAALRERPEVVDGVLEVGERLRSAQTRLDAAALRGLRTEREQALSTFTRAVAEVARGRGQELTPTVLTDVRATAVAALSSGPAASALGSGALTRALSYSGFGEVDLADAVAHTATGVRLAVIRGGRADNVAATPTSETRTRPRDSEDSEGASARAARREEERREGARREAQLTLARARRELDAAISRLDQAREASDHARQQVAAARRELAEAEAEDEARLLEVSDAVRSRSEAHVAVDTAADTLRELQDGD